MLLEQVTETAADEVVIITDENTQQVWPPRGCRHPRNFLDRRVEARFPTAIMATRYDVIVRRYCETSGEFSMERGTGR
jgi:hypothetical protein